MYLWDTNFDLGDTRPFCRAGYRGNELVSAVLRVQLKRIEPVLQKTRANRSVLVSHLNAGQNYQLQHVDDPEGDASISFGLISGAFPDRHLYMHWDAILNKTGATDRGYPWKDPAYLGNVEYSVDMCPNILDILPRTLKFGINAEMTEQNMIEIADAINKVDARI